MGASVLRQWSHGCPKKHSPCEPEDSGLGVHLHPEPISGLDLLIHAVSSVLCTQWALKKLSQPSLGYLSALKMWYL